VGLSLLGLTGWLLQNFLQLRGVVNLIASRIDLGFLFLALVLFGWLITSASECRKLYRTVTVILCLFIVVGLDIWAPKPQSTERPTTQVYILRLRDTVKEWGASERGCTVTLDTSLLASYEATHTVGVGCYLNDPAVDVFHNTNFAVSTPHHIIVGRQDILVPWNSRLKKPKGFGTPKQNWDIGTVIFIAPKNSDCTTATSISELGRCGAQATVRVPASK